MTPYHQQDGITLYHGDCREVLATLPDESVHAVVTDPPYGLSFMSKRWDYDVPSTEVWQQCLRVLKPGGHLLAFAGTRTQHRMAVRIEDAGFEIRDMIAWVYGSGFPKSLDVSKAIDKAAGAEREAVVDEKWAARYPNGPQGKTTQLTDGGRSSRIGTPMTSLPATDDAKRWQGWGTALKPALEPITVARKPLCGTVAANVLTHGTGGLNVDGCRVGTDTILSRGGRSSTVTGDNRNGAALGMYGAHAPLNTQHAGRWPANLIHDGSDEVTALFPETAPSKASAGVTRKNGVLKHGGQNARPSHNTTDRITEAEGYDDAGGSAARFFYTAKADRSDRGHGNTHPTVKPVDLMRYLIRLVCPVDGLVLDPFAGSGTTLVAAQDEHCKAIGIEREEQYCEFIRDERLKQRRLF